MLSFRYTWFVCPLFLSTLNILEEDTSNPTVSGVVATVESNLVFVGSLLVGVIPLGWLEINVSFRADSTIKNLSKSLPLLFVIVVGVTSWLTKMAIMLELVRKGLNKSLIIALYSYMEAVETRDMSTPTFLVTLPPISIVKASFTSAIGTDVDPDLAAIKANSSLNITVSPSGSLALLDISIVPANPLALGFSLKTVSGIWTSCKVGPTLLITDTVTGKLTLEKCSSEAVIFALYSEADNSTDQVGISCLKSILTFSSTWELITILIASLPPSTGTDAE